MNLEPYIYSPTAIEKQADGAFMKPFLTGTYRILSCISRDVEDKFHASREIEENTAFPEDLFSSLTRNHVYIHMKPQCIP